MAILSAGKCDTDDSQILVNVKNRGGIWLLTDNGPKLFENVEHLFRENTLGFKTKIQYDQLTLQILEDPSINAYYSNMVDNAEMEVEEGTSNNLLEVIIGLYIRVRCYSYAKDIKEKEKVKRKSIQKQSPRAEIKSVLPLQKVFRKCYYPCEWSGSLGIKKLYHRG